MGFSLPDWYRPYATPEAVVRMGTPIYLTGASNEHTRKAAAPGGELHRRLGLLTAPKNVKSYSKQIKHYHYWAMDNGCFTSKGEFDGDEYLRQLDRIMNTIPDAHTNCLFATAPDVFDPKTGIGDPIATIERSMPFLPKIRDIGVPAGLVAQDGLENMIDEIPWDEFDVLFLGGSTEFKLGYPIKRSRGVPIYNYENEASDKWAALIYACHDRGKAIHVGRSNSFARLMWAYRIGAESADGTFIMMAPGTNTERVKGWYRKLWGETLPAMKKWFEENPVVA